LMSCVHPKEDISERWDYDQNALRVQSVNATSYFLDYRGGSCR
jgi:hypothetical protein